METGQQERMNIVIVGHVDHGKSTVIGRLLADTGSLPQGKLEAVKLACERNAKPFEYAFLLDALKDEQAQGITIDTARVFFKSDKRHYIIIDAPGHIEFLKNMITGAARAEAALLVIDAQEGIRENSRRHGYLMSMLGIKQLIVLVNKMDLVEYSQAAFDTICSEYAAFLEQIHVHPKYIIPIAAREGENLIHASSRMPWYNGPSVLQAMDAMQKEIPDVSKALRFPVQDIYKFTAENDDRRIVAGTIATGEVRVGDAVTFYPSQKKSRIKSIEGFNVPSQNSAQSGQATGVTLETQIYIRSGEVMAKESDPAPFVSSAFRAHVFWLGKRPLIKEKRYKLKIGTHRVPVYVKTVHRVLDASSLDADSDKQQLDRHDVGDVEFEAVRPLAFDLSGEFEQTGRFVLVDEYDIAGGGIIVAAVQASTTATETFAARRNFAWVRGDISPSHRAIRYRQEPIFVLIVGAPGTGKAAIATALEKDLFERDQVVYYLGVDNITLGLDRDVSGQFEDRDEHIRRIGETAHLMMDAGLIVISTISDVDDGDVKRLMALASPFRTLVAAVGEWPFEWADSAIMMLAEHDTAAVDRIVGALRPFLHS
ncbi:MAG: GTP-binding protein [Candidatus Margulisiibacteriota bacterium]